VAELTLSDGTRSYDFLGASAEIYVQADGINLPVVTDDNTFAETPDSEGRSRIRSRATNPEGSFAAFFKADTDATFWDNVDNLQELVLSAHRNKGTLSYTPPNGTQVTYDLEAINVTDLPQRGVQLRQRHGEATVTFETKPYGRLADVNIGGYLEVAQDLSPSILLALDATNGVTDLSGNGRNGTGAGSITIGGWTPGPLAVGDDGATDFDGTDDRITTTYGTRRNYMTNPRAVVDTSGWTVYAGTTLTRDSSGGPFNDMPCFKAVCVAGATTRGVNLNPDIENASTVAGKTWTASVWVKFEVGVTATLGLYGRNSAGSLKESVGTAIVGTGAWERFSATRTMTHVDTVKVDVAISDGADDDGAHTFYYWGQLVELAGTLDTYFDGSGYIDDAGAWQDSDGIRCGWTGTAHASASDKGCYAVGTDRTFSCWFNRDEVTDTQRLFGQDGTTGASAMMIYGTDGKLYMRLDVDDPSNTSLFSATEPDFLNRWVHAVSVIGADGSAAIYIDGELSASATLASTQWNQPMGNLRISGLGTGTTGSFDGKMQGVAVYERGLTADEIQQLYGAGAAVWTLDGPIDYFTVSGVTGQVPAWPDLTLTDPDTQARNHVEIGVQDNFDPDNAEPLLRNLAAGLTAQGGSSSTHSGSYSTNTVLAVLTTSPVSVCTAAGQAHKGKWKVRARVYPSATTVLVRLAWRAGNGPFAQEKWIAVPGNDAWYDLDLGTVDIKELPSGHTSEFRVEARSTEGVPTVHVDIMTLIPADSLAVLRGSTTEDTPTGAAVAAEDFSTHATAALSGTTPLLVPSGNWGVSGSGGTYYTSAARDAYIETSGDASTGLGGEFARLGTGTLTNGNISAQVETDYREYWTGVFMRYTATNNWLAAVFARGNMFSDRFITLIKDVAGTPTVMGITSCPTDSWIYMGAGSTGDVGVLTSSDGSSWTWRILVLADSDVATAGALASGGYGIYHTCWDTVDTSTARFDNIAVVGDAELTSISNPALNADQTLSVLHNNAITATSTGSNRTPIREGRYPRLLPATRNATDSRIVVRARRDDIDNGFADTGETDTLTGSLTVTPRVHLLGG
jgi:hypothetical protein